MFESDDYDQVLSQFELPELAIETKKITNVFRCDSKQNPSTYVHETCSSPFHVNSVTTVEKAGCSKISRAVNTTHNVEIQHASKNSKRKIIDSLFDNKNKRKFPGPAGLLSSTPLVDDDHSIKHMEIFSQDVDLSYNYLQKDIFDTGLWQKLLRDIKIWNLHELNSISHIKHQALSGNLCRRKAKVLTAFVESVDRSGSDPLIILRDSTGNIKGTLHRDAWTTFSPFIVCELCALVLWRPTVLTTGSVSKKHYLNITLNNIFAIYSSPVIISEETENKILSEGYTKLCEDNITIIKTARSPHETSFLSEEIFKDRTNDLFDGLDSIFSEEIF